MNQQLALQILGLNGIVTREQVKKAYRTLCKDLHPDDNYSKEAHEKYLQVQMAYQWMMTFYVFPMEGKQVRIYGNITSSPSSKGNSQTGKIIGGCSVQETQYTERQYRQMQMLKEKQKQMRQEEQERKQKIWEAMQNARKLPSQREAEKWKKIEAKREAERIAEIIKQLIMLEKSSDK